VTIPAEKEIIEMVTDAHNARQLMELMIDAGHLDRPGKGIIYEFNVNSGLLNTRYYAGETGQAASIAQIISAIDEIKGDTGWRKREFDELEDSMGRKYLENLVNLLFICDEGRAYTLVAVEAGAAGATISKIKHLSFDPARASGISPAREAVMFIVGPGQVETVAAALEKNGAFDNRSHGQLFSSPVPRAFTYIPPKTS
jgi:hypothetical protein